MRTVKIQIPSIVDNIRIVESFIDNVKEKYDINDDIYGNIMIAVTEAVNNAIKHGNNCDKTKNVTLIADYEDHQVTFTVEDEGNGFDPNSLPDPTAPDNLEKLGGRGIFLMKQLTDEVSFDRDGRVSKMIFYF